MGGLIERSAALGVVGDALARAASGRGSTVVLSGGAGLGRTALLRHARKNAAALGFRVLASSPTPVTVGHSQAVARDWLAPLARAARPGQRPFDGPATGLAEALRSGAQDHPAWELARLDYALTWLLDNLTDHAPVLLAVDDAQWADPRSLELLDLLSARVALTGVVLALAVRAGEAPSGPDPLDRVLGRAAVVEPEPLSRWGVGELVRESAGSPAAGLDAAELHRRTGGVPFLVRELLRAGTVDEVPRTVVEWVADRLGRLDDATAELARTVAVLADEASLDALAAVRGVTVAALADPLDALAAAGLVRLGLWRARPACPLLAEALLGAMTPSARSDLHRRAAALLVSLERPPQVVAGHLVHTLPHDDPEVVALLREAAEASLAAGRPADAAQQLLRAVGETPPADTDPALVALAASAHLTAGLQEEALLLWREAQERGPTGEQRAAWLAAMGEVQMSLGDCEGARACYRAAHGALVEAGRDGSGPDGRLLLARAGMAQALLDGTSSVPGETVAQVLDREPAADTHADRLLLGLAACGLALRGEDRESARALARRALGDSALLREETSEGTGFHLTAGVLTWADAYAESSRVLDAAVEDSRARGSVVGFCAASTGLGLVHLRQGRFGEALARFDAALQRRAGGGQQVGDPTVAGAVLAHLGLGQTDAARALEPALRRASRRGQLVDAHTIATAGRVRAADGDHEHALDDFLRAGRMMGGSPDNASVVEWREPAVWSLLALDRRAEAEELSALALEHARRWGAPRAVGVALRTRAQVLPRDEAEAHLREALDLVRPAGLVDHIARTEVDLGRLLADRSRRADAVALLRSGVEHARAAGALPVTRRATRLLTRLGVRLTDGAGSPLDALTPGERRVVELAASGLTNRQVARELVVTVKAVEWHLSHAYRKLGVGSRDQLAGMLYGSSSSDM